VFTPHVGGGVSLDLVKGQGRSLRGAVIPIHVNTRQGCTRIAGRAEASIHDAACGWRDRTRASATGIGHGERQERLLNRKHTRWP